MKKENPIILAPNGFPWRAALIGLAVVGAGSAVGHMLLPGQALGGIVIVCALVGIAAFAGSLR